MDAELERKLREQLDRDEIWRVMQKYGRGLDRLDNELIRSCYWDDCIEDHGVFVGDPDSFIEWAAQTTLAFERASHAILNHYCELDGDDAHCETYYLFVGVAKEPPHFMSTGRYIDHFQKRNGEWRFANRVTIIDSGMELAQAALDRGVPPVYSDDPPPPVTRDRNDVSYQRPLRPRRPK